MDATPGGKLGTFTLPKMTMKSKYKFITLWKILLSHINKLYTRGFICNISSFNVLAVVADTFPDRALVVLVSPNTAAAFPGPWFAADATLAKLESAPNPPTAALFKFSFGWPLLAG